MADNAPTLPTFYGLTNGFNNPNAGSVANLLDPSAYSFTVGNFGSPGLGGLTAPAAAAFQNFTAGAFNSLQSVGASNFAFLGQTFGQWASYQESFADRMANIFQTVANKSGRATTGILGSIFGF